MKRILCYITLLGMMALSLAHGGMGFGGGGSGVGDNLGNHTATTFLDMSGYAVYNTSAVVYGDGSVQYSANVPQVEYDLYLSSNASDIASYNLMYSTPTVDPQQTILAHTYNTVVIASFTTYGSTGTLVLGEGVYHTHLHALASGVAPANKSARLYAEFYYRTSPAGVETKFATSEQSDVLTTTEMEFDMHAVVASTEIFIVPTMRVVVKIRVALSGAGPTNPNVSLFVEGTTGSRVELATTVTALDNRYVMKVGNSAIDGSLAISTNITVNPASAGVTVYSNNVDINGFYLYSQSLGTELGHLCNAGNFSQLALGDTSQPAYLLQGSSNTAAANWIRVKNISISSVTELGFADGSKQTTAGGAGSSDEKYLKLFSGGDIYSSSATFAAVPDAYDILMNSITVTGVFFFQYQPSTIFPSEFNIAISTQNDFAPKTFTYLFDKAQSLGVNIGSSTVVSISTPLAGGTWYALHVTTCATTGVLPYGFGAGIRYKRN